MVDNRTNLLPFRSTTSVSWKLGLMDSGGYKERISRATCASYSLSGASARISINVSGTPGIRAHSEYYAWPEVLRETMNLARVRFSMQESSRVS